MNRLAIEQPTSLNEVMAILAEGGPDAKVVAGGTALVLMMQQGLAAPEMLVSVERCDELRGIRTDAGNIVVGATTTLTEVAAHPDVTRLLPSLAEACRRVGNVRVRNVATLGGNLAEADYASDPPSVLSCVGATCLVRSLRGERWIPAQDVATGFYENALENDEVLVAISIPTPAPDESAIYLKYVSRSSEDRPCVGVAAKSTVRDGIVVDVDVVVGAVAPIPQRVPEALRAAVGKSASTETGRAIARSYAEAIEPIEDLRGSEWYRRRMIAVHVERALAALWAGP
jgi:aerobic carbon-monoxide dehydrogenase medium subunit